MNESILVGVANDGEIMLPLDVINKWNPEKITFLGDTVFFKVGDRFHSIKRVDFCKIFGEKCAFIKNK
jgi:hypothetical protein